MGLQSLQQLIESQFAGACVSVDLLRIASSVTSPYQGRVALSLVVDAECCLDRLYGGYVSGESFPKRPSCSNTTNPCNFSFFDYRLDLWRPVESHAAISSFTGSDPARAQPPLGRLFQRIAGTAAHARMGQESTGRSQQHLPGVAPSEYQRDTST